MRLLKQSEEDALNLRGYCRKIAGRHKIKAASVNHIIRSGQDQGVKYLEILIVLNKYRPIANFSFQMMNDTFFNALLVDSRFLEVDVEKGWMGDVFSEKISFLYHPIINYRYLRSLEMKLKQRIIFELTRKIVTEYPELSRELLIKPEYFIYETMYQKTRFNPILINKYSAFLEGKSLEDLKESYLKAVKKLVDEELLLLEDGLLKIGDSFFRESIQLKAQINEYLKFIQRTAFQFGLNSLPDFPSVVFRILKFFQTKDFTLSSERFNLLIGDTKRYIYIPTIEGKIPLSENTTIEDFFKKRISDKKSCSLKMTKLGGVLNSVYKIEWLEEGERHKIVAKKFQDWSSLKWVPLALWAVGTKDFAIMGRTRLEREYTSNLYLFRRGFPVPKIIYISYPQKLIFQEFIEGEPLLEVVKKAFLKGDPKASSIFADVGKTMARAHNLGVALGDCKPENFIVGRENKIYFVDLEQATKGGDYGWDLAEFLYYSGHYADPLSKSKEVDLPIKNFISGYIEGGGDIQIIREIAALRFVKTFSLFTPPQILYRISRLCKEV